MKNIDYTCKTRLIPGNKDGEETIVIRLDGTDTRIHHVVEGEEYGPNISYTNHFLSGPVADKLYAYEELGYSPEALKKIIYRYHLDKARDLALNSVYGTIGENAKNNLKRYLNSMAHNCMRSQNMQIKKVIFNDPATIVFWADGSKTVVKATNEPFDREKGLAMAISKRALGDKGNYYEVFKKHLNEVK